MPLTDSDDEAEITEHFTDGYWTFLAGDSFVCSDYDISLEADGFTSQTVNGGTRVIKRTNGGEWDTDGLHEDAVGNLAGRSGLNGISNTGSGTQFALAVSRPVIFTQPANTSTCDGQDASFSLVARGAGPFNYQWYKVGTPDEELPGETGDELAFTPALAEDAGEYYCIVTDRNSNTHSSDTVELTVHATPDAPDGTDVTVIYDGSAHTASALAEAGSSVVWYTTETGDTETTAPSATDAGTYTAWAAARDDVTSCESATRTLVTLTINPKELVVTPAASQSKVYGDVEPVLSFTASGFEGGDDEDILTGALGRDPGEDVDDYDITIGDLSAGDNYTITLDAEIFSITRKTLNTTVNVGQSKVYGEDDPVFTYTASGFAFTEDETIITGALARAGGEDVGDYQISLGDLSAGNNYSIDFTPANFAITLRTLTITPDPGQSKVYGQSDPVAFTYDATGFAFSDNQTIITGSLARINGEDVDDYDITIGTLSAGSNYSIDLVPEVFSITPKTLTITPDPGQTKVYGSTDPEITYTAAGFVLPDNEDLLSGELGRFAGENVGNFVIVTGSLSAGSNYSISVDPEIFTITPATLNISANAGQSKVYGAPDPIFSFTATGYQLGDDETIFTGALSRDTGEDVGGYAITQGDLSAGGNYTINFTSADFEITTKELVITPGSGQTKVYGQPDPAFTFSATGFELSDDETIISGSLQRAAGQNVGTYAFNLGTLDAGINYSLTLSPETFEITTKELVITPGSGQSKVYGQPDPAFTFSATGFELSDDISLITGSLQRAAGESAGTYAFNLGTLDAGVNYSLTLSPETFEITTKELVITPDSGQSKVYGQPDPAFTFSATGFELSDDISLITGSLQRAAGQNVGTYAFNLGTLDAGVNYSLTLSPETFEITTKELVITPGSGQTKVYGQPDPAFNFSATGFELSDDETIISGSLQRAAGESVGTYAFNLGTLDAGVNYSLTLSPETFEITTKELVITPGSGQTKVYGQPDPAFTFSATGFDFSDNISLITGSLQRAAGESAGTYAFNLGTLDAGINYSLTLSPETFEITTKELVITPGSGQSKVYGQPDPAFNFSATGFELSDDETIISGSLQRAAGESVGTYAFNLGTLDAGVNYSLTLSPETFEITTKELVITPGSGQTKVYGQPDPAFTFSATGFEFSDDISLITGSLQRAAGESVGTAKSSRPECRNLCIQPGDS
jgi:hypothetical protein